MSRESRRLSGILLIILPTVIYGGVSIQGLLMNDRRYVQNHLRRFVACRTCACGHLAHSFVTRFALR